MEPLPALDAVLQELRERGIELPPGQPRLDAFGDTDALSIELLALIAGGKKRAGAGLLWAHEAEAQELPAVGDIEIVLDHRMQPALLLRVSEVEVVPFSAVSAEFAAREGEGDGSLAYWQRMHRNFFARECARIGRSFDDAMPVVCESFELLRVLPPRPPSETEP